GKSKAATALRIRESVCKPTEIQVSPASIGIRPSAVWKDQNGKIMGAYSEGGYVLLPIPGRTLRVRTDGFGNLPVAIDNCGGLYLESSDCSGTALLGATARLISQPETCFLIRGGIIYYAPDGDGATFQINSVLRVSDQYNSAADCGGGTFSAPNGCCQTLSEEYGAAGPAPTIDINSFVQPLQLVVE